MNIKNSRAVEASKQLAALTGESLTTAITVAVEERLARLEREAEAPKRRQRLAAIADDVTARLSPEARTANLDALLYDEKTGLPR